MLKRKWLLFIVPMFVSTLLVTGYLVATSRQTHDSFEFKNSSSSTIWVKQTQGFDKYIRCGVLSPGATASLRYMDAIVPEKAIVRWYRNELDEGPLHSFEIDLTVLTRLHASDTLVFEFHPDETWTAEFRPEPY